MRVVQVHVPGGPDALRIVDVATPQPGAGQVRVKAHAIGVGGPDRLIRKGTYKWMPPLPAVPGNEMAGVIDAVGDGVTQWVAGQRVLVSSRELPERGGCYAEAICVPEDAPFALPDGVSLDAAVSLGNFQLAHALLLGCNGGLPVKSILVPGAAGGVAGALTQLARHHGMYVIGTASTAEKQDFALANGAHVVLEPDAAMLPDRVLTHTSGRGVDLAFDHLGGTMLIACIRSLAPLGTAISYNIVSGPPASDVFTELRLLLGKSLAVRTFSIHTFDQDRAQRRGLMESAIRLMAAGHVQAPPATVMPLADVQAMHTLLDSGQALGKLILRP